MALKEFKTSKQAITDRSRESVTLYLRDLNKHQGISVEEEAELAQLIRRGGPEALEARNRLIQANLRFVVSVAKSYQSQTLELADLISEGNIGLIKAAELFDETKGFKFISYAVWWIRQSILAAVEKASTTLRLPQNQQSILRQFHQMQADMYQKEQRPLSIDEFCEVSGQDPERVSQILSSTAKPMKMDEKVSEGSDTTFGEFLASDSVSDSSLEMESLRYDLNDLIDHVLNPKEAFIVRHHYGMGTQAQSLEDIAFQLHISRERARQLCCNAIDRIRTSPHAKKLLAYLAA